MTATQARIDAIRARHRRVADAGFQECAEYGEAWPCDAVALLSELDAATARAAEVERLTQERDAGWAEVARVASLVLRAHAERDALAVQVAALREAGETLASVVLLLEEDEPVEPTEVRRVALRIQGALDRWRAALAAAGGPDRDYCRACAADWPGRQA